MSMCVPHSKRVVPHPHEDHTAPIVAVNVFPYLRGRDDTNGVHQGGLLGGLLKKLKPVADMGPPLFDVMMRATFVGSQRTTEMSLSAHPPALYLVPDVSKFRILDWRAYEAIFRAGYDCAKRELDAGALPRALWAGSLDVAAT